MSRLRWGLGAALALVALVAAASAIRTYLGHQLWLGGLAVLVLIAIDLTGFASLALARRRLAVELRGLCAEPPSGTLLDERRRQLVAIRATSARPNLEVLAEATAARELGRAYLGKYLVAVTVLVGLVGTFAGLMETLRGVAPLLADERVTTLQALAAPLAGLDVTFGASLVGILVTLALALVQGDLALAEEEALTRLEERTRHVLLPSLWPPEEAAEERAARELVALRQELASFVVRAAEASTAAVESGSRAAATIAQACQLALSGIGRSVEELSATQVRLVGETTAALHSVSAATSDGVARLQTALSTLGAQQADASRQLGALQSEASRQLLATQAAELSSLATAHAERLTRTSQALCETIQTTVGGEGLKLAEAARALFQAAQQLATSATELGMPLGALAPELGALSREVALLAARGDAAEPVATLDELVRLGEGVERLEGLLRLSQGQPSGGQKA